jgi:maltooligosyltrehalose trehalohydrolase
VNAVARAGAYSWQRQLGAVVEGGGTRFRVWCKRGEVAVGFASGTVALEPVGFDVWEGSAEVGAGEDYWFVIERERLADPCSRWQPDGIGGPSRVFDPRQFDWSDDGFRPPALPDSVIYELHVGTFTAEGTLDSAITELERLAGLGITTVELMPLAEGPGERGWGYDGVYISAVNHAYGGPAALQRFVDAAHRVGLAVMLDVVYNHVGPLGGGELAKFGPYFTSSHHTPWGDAINFCDEDCDPVREWVAQSAAGWIRDFHVDGLRLDAIDAIYDQGPRHIVSEVVERVHAANANAVVIAEAGLNDPRVIRPLETGGLGCDAQWADDFHHALHVLLTGERDGYYADFGSIADLAKAFQRPFVNDGRYSPFRRRLFGAPANDRPVSQFVVFSQNHDQVGNRAIGDRLPTAVRPLAAFCVLLSPFVPLLFMGEEYGETAPFQFFADHPDPEIANATREGRRREFARFASFTGEVPDPEDEATFRASKLSGAQDSQLEGLYAALIRGRRDLRGEVEVIGLDEESSWLRLRRGAHEMICNFGGEPQTFDAPGARVLLATAPCESRSGVIDLPALAGVLLG